MTATRSATSSPDDGTGLLAELIGGTREDDEQLRVLHRAITEALELPADVHVVGEPLTLVGVEYAGNPRRGLVARCRR
ncbi:MAG: cytoplasmic protein, partial [Deltaproteobacteria bacterium]|nr:cytoplasmic protein [Deltaproteobacteria bacterium]